MNRSCKQYRNQIKRRLFCSGIDRRRLLAQYDEMLLHVLTDDPEPNLSDLFSALGSPDELSADLMREIPEKSQIRWQKRRRFQLITSFLVAVILVVSCGTLVWRSTHREVITAYEATFIGYPDEPEEEYEQRQKQFFDNWDKRVEAVR